MSNLNYLQITYLITISVIKFFISTIVAIKPKTQYLCLFKKICNFNFKHPENVVGILKL